MDTEDQVVIDQNSNVQTETETSTSVVGTSEIAAEKERRLGNNKDKAKAKVSEPSTPEVPVEEKPAEAPKTGDDKLLKKLDKQKEQIGKKTRQNYDLRRKNNELQQKIAELEKFAANAPQKKDYQNDSDFLKAEIKHETKVELEREQLEKEIKTVNQDYHQEFTGRMREQLKEPDSVINFYEKYHDKIKTDEPELYESISSSKYGPIILERFLNHTLADTEVYADWRNMTPFNRMKQISQLEDYIESLTKKQAEPFVQEKSAAPAPLAPSTKPLTGGSGDSDSLEALIASTRQRRLNRR